jgi:capsular polysaccharide transport system ATP-binding protein
MSDAMIEFWNVTKKYKTKRSDKIILQDFSGEFPRGRSIGLLGRNGVGKSTLIRMIAGAEYPDRGKIKRNVRISFPLGMVGFKGTLTGRENCRFVARIYGLDVRAVERFVADFCELGKYFDMPVTTYSSGMRSKLTFAISMAADFECYLLDELLSVSDFSLKARATALFEEKRKNASLILVSHTPGEISRLCDMGAIMADGTLRMFEDVHEAVAEYERVPVPEM